MGVKRCEKNDIKKKTVVEEKKNFSIRASIKLMEKVRLKIEQNDHQPGDAWEWMMRQYLAKK